MDYHKHYNILINRALIRKLDPPFEKHHILPKCLGGSNSINNIAILSPEEHYIAHQLLVKMYPTNQKLIYAACMMACGRTNNKLYGWLKRKLSDFQKTKTGSNNSQFDRVWVTNGTINKKIQKNDILEIGWKYGRTNVFTIQQKISMQVLRKGKIPSKETRLKMSISQKNRFVSNEIREKISKGNIGKTISVETRLKQSEAKLGKKRGKMSDEQKRKISISKKYLPLLMD